MTRPSLLDRLALQAQQRAQDDATRRLLTVEQRNGVRLQVDGRWLVSFAGNDYLGLSDHPGLVRALQRAAGESGVGSASSHLVCGHHRPHAQLEEAVAEWLGQPRALLFGSGYLANLGALQALLERDDLCLQDRLNHACLLDGARLSGAQLKRYPHADVDAAARQLGASPERAALIATDGVFSMDGDIAPLTELAQLAERESATLYIDDAHGVGVLGAQGRGSADHCGLAGHQALLQLVTLGKAIGSYGALVVGSEALIDAVLQRARSYVFTTALPPALAAAALTAVRLTRDGDALRERLGQNIDRFVAGAQQLSLPLLPSRSPIQPLLLGNNAAALAASLALRERGLWVPAIRPPTVPAGSARLRVSLSAAHSPDDIDALLDGLADCVPRHQGD